MMRVFLPATAAVLLALGGSSCVLAIGNEAPESLEIDETGARTMESSAAKAGSKKKERELAKLEGKLQVARAELEISQLSTRADLHEAELAMEAAKRELEEAERALKHFDGHELPRRMAEGKLDLDRSRNRAEEAEAELKELESMYAQEEFAELTKELVLTRGRRSLEFAQRGLAIQAQTLTALESEVLPRERRAKEKTVREARQGLEKAETKLKKERLESELALLKGRQSLQEAERDLEDARKAPGKSKDSTKDEEESK